MGELENMDEKSIIFDKKAFKDVLDTMWNTLYETANKGREHNVENVPADLQSQLDNILFTLEVLSCTIEVLIGDVL